jgi:hypothetical protein
LRVANNFPELLKLRVFRALIDLARKVEQLSDLVALGLKLAECNADHAAHSARLDRLVFFQFVLRLLFVASLVGEHIAQVSEIALKCE